MNVSQRSLERKSGVIKINKKKFAEFAKAKGLKIREYDTDGGGLQRKIYYEVIGMALYFALSHSFKGEHTPREYFLKALRHVLSGMPERIWDLERELRGWELGGEPDLLSDNEHDEYELDTESEEF